ncbi:MAG: hypothetical protein Q4G39_00050 [Brachymonas sp.]|nr:hypothetical protein [Brachymonas sp.]
MLFGFAIVMLALGLLSGLALVLAALGMVAVVPGMTLWITFPVFCIVGFLLAASQAKRRRCAPFR